MDYVGVEFEKEKWVVIYLSVIIFIANIHQVTTCPAKSSQRAEQSKRVMMAMSNLLIGL